MKDTAIFDVWHTLKPLEKFVQLAAYHCDILKAQEEPHGSNKGHWVSKYLKSAGINYPAPWCASFITYLLKECGFQSMPDHPAAVIEWARWAEKSGRIVTRPQRSDLFFTLNSDGTGHIGIVLENMGKTVRTIEGNSNDDGDREGYEVCRRERNISGLRFIRL